MTGSVVAMIVIGLILIFVSFFISEKFTKKEENSKKDFLTVDEDYEFSERELRIIKRKIEDVIARQAKDILYETNESLSSMANEKTMALGDYAVTVCDEIEKNHKEAMFLYSMLDDKQKEIMNTVRVVDAANKSVAETVYKVEKQKEETKKTSAIDQLSNLRKMKEENVQLQSSDSISVEEKEKPKQEEPKKEEIKKEVIKKEVIKKEVLENPVTETKELDVDLEDVFAEIDETDIDFDEVLEKEFKESENSNDIILEMYRNGSNIIEIAKQLGLGVGEVKLVIDLYQGE